MVMNDHGFWRCTFENWAKGGHHIYPCFQKCARSIWIDAFSRKPFSLHRCNVLLNVRIMNVNNDIVGWVSKAFQHINKAVFPQLSITLCLANIHFAFRNRNWSRIRLYLLCCTVLINQYFKSRLQMYKSIWAVIRASNIHSKKELNINLPGCNRELNSAANLVLPTSSGL